MKYTLFVTQRCNLACSYCYISKKNKTIDMDVAQKTVDYIYDNTPLGDEVDIGFFGGEPLLEFDVLKQVTELITRHPQYDARKVVLRVVSNGTVFSDEIAAFLEQHAIGLGISCDGPPHIQDRHRKFKNGKGSGRKVEQTIRKALQWFPLMPVNAVYTADTLRFLPETLDYLSDLGVKNIHFNQDISSAWRVEDIKMLDPVYGQIAEKYLDFYFKGNPRYISLIDSKITVILRGGYQAEEKCSMGVGELAFATSGNMYLCERLVGGDDGGAHCIGNVNTTFPVVTDYSNKKSTPLVNRECQECTLKEYCMNWCGCTNFSGTGKYNRVSPFTCASEKAAIRAALGVIERTRRTDISFSAHLAGTPLLSIMGEVSGSL